jgi:hypothetical protein
LFYVHFVDSGYIYHGRWAVRGDQREVEMVDFDVHRLFHRFFDGRLMSFASKYYGSTFRHRDHITDSSADGYSFYSFTNFIGEPSSHSFAGRVHRRPHDHHVNGARADWFCLDLWVGVIIQRL